MYVITTHIPVFVDGNRYFTDVNWQLDLILARDWLACHFRGLTVLSPSLPMNAVDSEAMRIVPIGHDDGIRVIPSFDKRCRTRDFWVKQRYQWTSDVQRTLATAKVIHNSAVEAFRPIWYLAQMEAYRAKVTTVLVGPDMDPHATSSGSLKDKLDCFAFDFMMRRAVTTADLTLLKEGLVYDRYSRYGENTKGFCHSMHIADDVLHESQLELRLKSLDKQRPLRVVYAGRLVARKGLRDAIDVITLSKRLGSFIEYHIFGSGPEEANLRQQAIDNGVDDLIHFHGFVEYTSDFISRLATYDLLLFMPTEEDTPRMLYDAMAAGLPVVGTRIPFLVHRVKQEGLGVLVDIHAVEHAAEQLRAFDMNRESLKAFSRSAREAGKTHSIQNWYRRRADWTLAAVASRRPANKS